MERIYRSVEQNCDFFAGVGVGCFLTSAVMLMTVIVYF